MALVCYVLIQTVTAVMMPRMNPYDVKVTSVQWAPLYNRFCMESLDLCGQKNIYGYIMFIYGPPEPIRETCKYIYKSKTVCHNVILWT